MCIGVCSYVHLYIHVSMQVYMHLFINYFIYLHFICCPPFQFPLDEPPPYHTSSSLPLTVCSPTHPTLPQLSSVTLLWGIKTPQVYMYFSVYMCMCTTCVCVCVCVCVCACMFVCPEANFQCHFSDLLPYWWERVSHCPIHFLLVYADWQVSTRDWSVSASSVLEL